MILVLEQQQRGQQQPSPPDARPILPWAAFFLGEIRDGLPMLNMRAVFLVSACNYKEKQMGVLFLTFGVAQTLFMAPAGYCLDYSNHKIRYLMAASLAVSLLTVISTWSAAAAASTTTGQDVHMAQQIVLHALQGGCSALLPPAFNGITLGITGQAGLTQQVSRNRCMNHWGTCCLVAVSCATAYTTFPNVSVVLFVVSPLAALMATVQLFRIPSRQVHRDAARGLIGESPTMTEYCLADDVAACKQAAMQMDVAVRGGGGGGSSTSMLQYQPPPFLYGEEEEDVWALDAATSSSSSSSSEDESMQRRRSSFVVSQGPVVGRGTLDASIMSDASDTSMPSFRFGWNATTRTTPSQQQPPTTKPALQALTPLEVLSDPLVRTFAATCFLFHLSNSSVLPLVMQSLALEDQRSGIVLSGLCIFIAQACMAVVAPYGGTLSATMGRKGVVLVGLTSLSLRCFVLAALLSTEDWFVDYFSGRQFQAEGTVVLKCLILATQLLDSVGAGIMGIMQILVTSDISGGSGRFSFIFGAITSSMCLGCTVSGYLGQAIAQDYGYEWAFTALGLISLVPVLLFSTCMPETLPDFTPVRRSRRQRFREWWKQERSSDGGPRRTGELV